MLTRHTEDKRKKKTCHERRRTKHEEKQSDFPQTNVKTEQISHTH